MAAPRTIAELLAAASARRAHLSRIVSSGGPIAQKGLKDPNEAGAASFADVLGTEVETGFDSEAPVDSSTPVDVAAAVAQGRCRFRQLVKDAAGRLGRLTLREQHRMREEATRKGVPLHTQILIGLAVGATAGITANAKAFVLISVP